MPISLLRLTGSVEEKVSRGLRANANPKSGMKLLTRGSWRLWERCNCWLPRGSQGMNRR
jgi:hypothetical protein